jgi:hypothetical protein
VPGGGVALLRASEQLKRIKTQNDDQKTGVEIVRKALSAPARQIAINAGEDGSVIVGKILEKEQYNYGFDSQTGEYGNLVSKGIIDPTKVVRCGDPERGLRRGSADHHRSHDRRTAEEGWRSRRRHAPGRRHGRHGLLIQPLRRLQEMQNPGSDAGVFVWADGADRLCRAVNTDARRNV